VEVVPGGLLHRARLQRLRLLAARLRTLARTAADERWQPDFMHVQADDVLPRLLAHHGIERPFLFGHSDGGSIALLHAARHPVEGVVVLAPHLFVEEISIASIREARTAYESGDLKRGLARYHADPDSAFYGWNDAWLSPAFRDWVHRARSRRHRLPRPRHAGHGRHLRLDGADPRHRAAVDRESPLARDPGCGHSPHRDQPAIVAREAARFIRDVRETGSRDLS
jgi:pimeloyl-ACP methyl ester carboxylesterase